jgi:polysaccharide biosynthesis transport protein
MAIQITSENQLQQVVNMFYRRRGLILLSGLLGACLAVFVGTIIPTKYTAKAQLVIDPQQISAAISSSGRPLAVNELAIETQVAMLSSRSHLRRVRDSLMKEPELQKNAFWSRPDWAIGSISAGAAESGERGQGEVPSVDELEKGLTAYQERQSRVVAITFTWTDPDQAAVIANQLARLHLAALLDIKKAETGSASFEQELSQLARQLSLARSELVGRETRLADLRALRQRPGSTDEFIEALNSSMLIELRRLEVNLLAASRSTTAPKANGPGADRNGMDRLSEVRRRIEDEVERAIGGLENEVHIARAHVHSLQQRVNMIEGARRRAREIEGQRPLAHLASAEDADPFQGLLIRQEKEMREQPEITPGVQILTIAEPPTRPSSPNPLLFVLPAFVAFTIVGALAATVREGLDRNLRNSRDIEEALGINCFGLLPRRRNVWNFELMNRYLKEYPLAAYTEALRSVVTSALKLTEPSPLPKVIMVTSSVPGEGISTLVVGFAAFAARLNRKVVAVDLAFNSPLILNTSERNEADSDVLDGGPWKELIRSFPDVDVHYLPLHHTSSDPAALLSEGKLPDLLAQLKESYDCIVIHSDPLLSATSSRLITSLADVVLLAVRWGFTRREVAQNALALIGAGKGRDRLSTVNAVITNVSLKKHATYGHGDVAEVLAYSRRW